MLAGILLLILYIVITITIIIFFQIYADKKTIAWYKRFENIFIVFGFLVVIIGIIMPFIILKVNNFSYSLKMFEQLGPVGDFFGGTTIGLLSLASLIFITATMFMQKEELELQRKEVEKTRKEYELTNRTMKKQSFDSTFFNMINLHQNILNEITIEDFSGRDAIKYFHNTLNIKNKKIIYLIIDDYYNNSLNKNADLENPSIYYANELLKLENKFLELKKINNQKWMDARNKLRYTLTNELTVLTHEFDMNKTELENKITQAKADNIEQYQELYKNSYQSTQHFKDYLKRVVNDSGLLKSYFEKETPPIIKINNLNYKGSINDFQSEKYKTAIYCHHYNELEVEIGHYYRNLYRTFKYVLEYNFSDNESKIDKKLDVKEKNDYLGILRSQLSSYELLMLLYNICYSQKGEDFHKILIGTDFFNSHIPNSLMIWENDTSDIEKFRD